MTQNQFLPEQVLIPFFGHNPIVGAEIGVLGASGSVAMLNRMPNLKLYCIDPWKHFPGASYEAERPQEWHDQNYIETLKRLKEFGERAVVLRMTSDDAFIYLQGMKFDFIWIDGSHQYEHVKKDCGWRALLKHPSILGGHDWQNDDVRKAVLEEVGDVELGEDFTYWRKYE